MILTLIGDIGGTNSRLALCEQGRPPAEFVSVRNQSFPDPARLLESFIESCGAKPSRALLAVAGPVQDGRVTMTNLGWQLDANALAAALALPQVRLINDFEAVAWAVPALQLEDTEQLGGTPGEPGRPIAVLGAGTGLGAAGLVPSAGDWAVVVGEGGHVTLAPSDDEESGLLAALRPGLGHVSAEKLVSGPGLVTLYRYFAGRDGSAPAADIGPDAIADGAAAGDPACRRAFDQLCSFLATVAGDLALTFGARGGVFIAGSLIPANLALFRRSPFRARFESKGRFSKYLSAVPVYVITRPEPGLLGLSRLAGAWAR